MSSLLKDKRIQLKMKALECSQDFSHYKSIGIFLDAQEQLTLQSMVGSGLTSNSFESLWLSSLPAKMKKIRSNEEDPTARLVYYKLTNEPSAQVS